MRRVVTLPQAPPVQLLGDAVVLRGPAAIDAYRLMARGVDAARREDGIQPSERLEQLLAALRASADAAMSAAGHADVREVPTSAVSTPGSRIGTREVADLLGLSERHVRRLAPEFNGRRHGNTWTYETTAVEAHLIARTTKENA